jgi:hypothetical protein
MRDRDPNKMKFEIEKSELLGKKITLKGFPGFFEESGNVTGGFGRTYYYPPEGDRQLVASVPLGVCGDSEIPAKDNKDYGRMRMERIQEFAAKLMANE